MQIDRQMTSIAINEGLAGVYAMRHCTEHEAQTAENMAHNHRRLLKV